MALSAESIAETLRGKKPKLFYLSTGEFIGFIGFDGADAEEVISRGQKVTRRKKEENKEESREEEKGKEEES